MRSRASRKPTGYARVLAELKERIAESRRRALMTVNRELVLLYWHIGSVIVQQQERAKWGDAVVEQLAADLRAEFPDMKGLSPPNLWKMRQFCLAVGKLDRWLVDLTAEGALVEQNTHPQIVSTVSRETGGVGNTTAHTVESSILATLSREIESPELMDLIASLSWSHHTEMLARCHTTEEHYFYMAMAVRERWSVRELRRQIESDLFTRYVSVREQPEKCLPAEAEAGELLPFKDHYVLEFLGLQEEYSERELRKAILANLRDFFLEFGRDWTFVGDEYPLQIGGETFNLDLLFFQRRLQALVVVELKIGAFKPEYVGKCQFYCAALDEQVRLPHEKPSIGLVLCKSANRVQVQLALTAAANRIGVATYQTALPDPKLIRQRLKQLPAPPGRNSGSR